MMNREHIIAHIKENYRSCELDEYILFEKNEGKDINNAGIDAQILFLEQKRGLEWLEYTFIENDYRMEDLLFYLGWDSIDEWKESTKEGKENSCLFSKEVYNLVLDGKLIMTAKINNA